MPRTFEDRLIMLAELTVRSDKIEAFLAYTLENLQVSRDYPGNITFDILLNEDQPEKVIFYEVWESPKAQRDYMAWRIKAGDLAKLLALLAKPPRFSALRSVVV